MRILSNKYIYALCVITIAFLLAFPMKFVKFFDDAYIHARVADNFWHYGFPVFNVINKIHFKVDSSTGWILLLNPLASGDLIVNIRWLEGCLIVFNICGFGYLLYKLPSKVNALAACSTIPFILISAYGGMETPIVTLLLILAAILYLNKKNSLVILCIALSVCFRLEMLVLLVLSLIYFMVIKKQKVLLIFIFPIVLLFLIEYYFMGSIIPHASIAKRIAYNLPIEESIRNTIHFGYYFPSLIILVFLLRISKGVHKYYFSDIFLFFALSLIFAWALSRIIIFPWYYCVLTTSFSLFVICDVESDKNRLNKVSFLMKILILFIILLNGIYTVAAMQSSSKSADGRVYRYLEIGAGLYQICPTCSLLTSEIGGLGYSFKSTVYDALGLADPEATKFHPMLVPQQRANYEIGAIPPDYVIYRQPDFIVSMPIFSYALRNADIIKGYYVYSCFFNADRSLTIWGDNKIQIFSKIQLSDISLAKMHCEK